MQNEAAANARYAEAKSALQRADFRAAEKLAKELTRMKYSGGFEILAEVYDAQDKPEKALSILEEGAKKAPGVWGLWLMLANRYSDRQMFGKAMDAYRRALSCQQVSIGTVLLNQALCLMKQSKFEEALLVLQELHDEAWRIQRQVMVGSILVELRRFDHAKQILEETIKELESADTVISATLHEELLAAMVYLALAACKSGAHATAVEKVLHAFELSKGQVFQQQTMALWILRESELGSQEDLHDLRLLISGVWHSAFEGHSSPSGFFRNLTVVARDPSDALTLASRLEPEEMRSSLRIHECESKGATAGMPRGVYFRSGYAFFEDGDS